MESWATINWQQAPIEVRRLQMRIAKAVREKRYGKVKALQWLLTHSFSAKLLAVKRVASSTGAHTPGVDGIVRKPPLQKMWAVKSLQRQGYNKYKGKLLIKPSKKNVKAFLDTIRALMKSQTAGKKEDLIQQLNTKIRG